jgi:hypothetical protein
MPEAALAQTNADWILPLQEIALRLHLLSETVNPRELAWPQTSKAAMHYGS